MFGEGNCRLPSDNMLMMDRITSITADGGEHGKGQIVAELDINPDLWFFDCHFKGDPVMPGCLGLDAMWQLVGFFLGWSGGQGLGRVGMGHRWMTHRSLRPRVRLSLQRGGRARNAPSPGSQLDIALGVRRCCRGAICPT